jgi:hypothetical protein
MDRCPERYAVSQNLRKFGFLSVLLLASGLVTAAAQVASKPDDPLAAGPAKTTLEQGRKIFRFDTFGDEDFWGGQLRLHDAIKGEKLGGVGPGLSPEQALKLGLKVDIEVLTRDTADAVTRGDIDLSDPAVTVLLLKLNAVVGLKGFFAEDGKQLKSVGITCALCHSTVNDFILPGVGRRLDGWPNRDLNVGEIIAFAPNLKPFADLLRISQADVRKAVRAWGPGKFDAELSLDGKAFRPDGKTAATLIPPAFGLAGVNNHTWTGSWGTVTYWNAFVANLEMHGKGTFYDPRLDNARKFPVAARARLGHKRDAEDLITAKLPALHFYQLALPTPEPPDGAFNETAARAGKALFNGKAGCARCHVPPLFTEPGWNLHTGRQIGIDNFQASRSPDGRYRTEPLRALWNTRKIHKGGFYHDGRFATLAAVVNHYDRHFGLGLSNAEKANLIEYLKSL